MQTFFICLMSRLFYKSFGRSAVVVSVFRFRHAYLYKDCWCREWIWISIEPSNANEDVDLQPGRRSAVVVELYRYVWQFLLCEMNCVWWIWCRSLLPKPVNEAGCHPRRPALQTATQSNWCLAVEEWMKKVVPSSFVCGKADRGWWKKSRKVENGFRIIRQ